MLFLCVIDIFSKYSRVIPVKDKIGIIITNVFLKILDEYNRKSNKIWLDKGSELYNRSIKSWLAKMPDKCIQHIMKENLLLLKGLLEP